MKFKSILTELKEKKIKIIDGSKTKQLDKLSNQGFVSMSRDLKHGSIETIERAKKVAKIWIDEGKEVIIVEYVRNYPNGDYRLYYNIWSK